MSNSIHQPAQSGRCRQGVIAFCCGLILCGTGLLAAEPPTDPDLFLEALAQAPDPDLVPAGWEVDDGFDVERNWNAYTSPARVLNSPPVIPRYQRRSRSQFRHWIRGQLDQHHELNRLMSERLVFYGHTLAGWYRSQMDAHHQFNAQQSERVPLYFRTVAEIAIYGTHGAAELIVQFPAIWDDCLADTWLRTQLDLHHERNRQASERFDPCLNCLKSELACVWCHFQYHFVNWRHKSVHLVGCMPEGYHLWPFIETVPHIEYHAGPLFACGPVEPGGSATEAAILDGEDSRAISQISLNITPPEGELPEDRAEIMFASAGTRAHLPGTHRPWNGMSYYWNASLLNHQPLYFEDVNLERHGFSHGICQPLVSGAHFFAMLPALPYMIVAQPFAAPVYTLGESRPGSIAPYVHELPPLDYEAAALAAAAAVGVVFLIP